MSKTKRIAIIEDCEDCPHFNCEYPEWLCDCEKLNRKIDYVDNPSSFPIPDDCPLEKTTNETQQH